MSTPDIYAIVDDHGEVLALKAHSVLGSPRNLATRALAPR